MSAHLQRQMPSLPIAGPFRRLWHAQHNWGPWDIELHGSWKGRPVYVGTRTLKCIYSRVMAVAVSRRIRTMQEPSSGSLVYSETGNAFNCKLVTSSYLPIICTLLGRPSCRLAGVGLFSHLLPRNNPLAHAIVGMGHGTTGHSHWEEGSPAAMSR